MNQPRSTGPLKSAALAVADVGLLFGYALAISLLARLLVFTSTLFRDDASNVLLFLAQLASSLVYLPSALLVRARLHVGQSPSITQGWADVAHYASALVNAVLWAGLIMGARVVLQRLRPSRYATAIMPSIADSRIRIASTVVLLVLLGLTASPSTSEARVTAACTDRLSQLPVGTSIERVRSVLDHAWSDPVPWPGAATPAATSAFPPNPTPGIPDLDTTQVDVLCTQIDSSIRRVAREVWVKISFDKRQVHDLRLYQCYHDSDMMQCVVPIGGNLQQLLPNADTWNYDNSGVYPVYPPDIHR